MATYMLVHHHYYNYLHISVSDAFLQLAVGLKDISLKKLFWLKNGWKTLWGMALTGYNIKTDQSSNMAYVFRTATRTRLFRTDEKMRSCQFIPNKVLSFDVCMQ